MNEESKKEMKEHMDQFEWGKQNEPL